MLPLFSYLSDYPFSIPFTTYHLFSSPTLTLDGALYCSVFGLFFCSIHTSSLIDPITALNTIYIDVSHMSISRPDLSSEGQDAESNCLLDTLIGLSDRYLRLTTQTEFQLFIAIVFPISLSKFIISATQD